MTFDEMTTAWQTQAHPSLNTDELRKVVGEQNRRKALRLWFSRFFLAFCLIAGVFNLVGQRWGNGDSWELVLSRFSVAIVALVIQWQVERIERRRLGRARELSRDLEAWLREHVQDLKSDLEPRLWKPIGFLAFTLAVVCWTKWIDYRNGTDTLAECVAIPLIVVAGFVVIAMMVVHHRSQFLKPELERFEGMMSDWEADQET